MVYCVELLRAAVATGMAAGLLPIVLVACNDTHGPVPGPPAALQIVAGDGQSAVVGTELPDPVVARVVDSAGLEVPGQLVNFRVTSGGGSVFAGAALTNDSGIARERWTLGTSTADSQRLEARAVDQQTGEALVYGVFQAIALAGAPARAAKLAGDSQAGVVGVDLPDSLAVLVTDAFANPVPGAKVIWKVVSGGGVLSPDTATGGADGVARGCWRLGTQPGANVATAFAAKDTLRFTATAAAGPPALLVKTQGDGDTDEVYQSHPLEVRVSDAFGNPVPAASVMFSTDSGAVSPASVQSDSVGRAMTEFRLPGAPGAASAVAALAGGSSATFTVRVTSSRWMTVATGGQHACALTMTGTAYCWGDNDKGQLGVGGAFPWGATVPESVTTSLKFQTLSLGYSLTCPLLPSGEAYCWGAGSRGGMGIGWDYSGPSGGSTPVAQTGGLTFTSIASGYDHVCAVTAGGAAYCWGGNAYGQLGAGYRYHSTLTPVPVAGGLTFTNLAAGAFATCGRTVSGDVYCWGHSWDGVASDSVPRLVDLGTTADTIVGSGFHFCTLSAGAARCWGDNSAGQLGAGDVLAHSTPVAVVGGLSFTSIAAGASHTCAQATDAVFCWGSNGSGEAGQSAGTVVTSPASVGGPRLYDLLVAGGQFTCGHTGALALLCWGSNGSGRLGQDTLAVGFKSYLPLAVRKPQE
jgi:alpha-tubulin suppressor-like RCC1 family protein